MLIHKASLFLSAVVAAGALRLCAVPAVALCPAVVDKPVSLDWLECT